MKWSVPTFLLAVSAIPLDSGRASPLQEEPRLLQAEPKAASASYASVVRPPAGGSAPGASAQKPGTTVAQVPLSMKIQLANSIQEKLKRADTELANSRLHFYRSRLFKDVQLTRLFSDSKTFPDCTPITDVPLSKITEEYEKARTALDFSLKKFVDKYFIVPESVGDEPAETTSEKNSPSVMEKSLPLRDYIESQWEALTKSFANVTRGSSLIPLPHRTLVPGGRFREWYYWDSYWPIRLFLRSGEEEKKDIAFGMIQNIKSLIDRFGFIPNGNRDYYLGRSQPPVFSLILEELLVVDQESALEFFPALEAAHEFWNHEAQPFNESLRAEADDGGAMMYRYTGGRERQLPDGTPVFAYDTSEGDLPRPEAYWEDSMSSSDDPNDPFVFRHIQAACESGWDFGSRFATKKNCAKTSCLETGFIAPIELQALLAHKAQVLSRLANLTNNAQKADIYARLAQDRIKVIQQKFWNERAGTYFDIDWRTGEHIKRPHAGMMVPLALGLVEPEQAERVIQYVDKHLLTSGGIKSTGTVTNQQWDAPYGWAPMQWLYVAGSELYGHHENANRVRLRWTEMVQEVFEKTGKVYEKYNVAARAPGSGGEYVVQAGFAFTNAVVLEFLNDLEMEKIAKGPTRAAAARAATTTIPFVHPPPPSPTITVTS